MHKVTQQAVNGKKVIITETGWPNQGENNQEAQPTADNAMKYFISANKWAQDAGVELFYFSSFDESWKVRHEGDVGARWGLWDNQEQLKY